MKNTYLEEALLDRGVLVSAGNKSMFFALLEETALLEHPCIMVASLHRTVKMPDKTIG